MYTPEEEMSDVLEQQGRHVLGWFQKLPRPDAYARM